jgi:hypothetical protein
MKIGNAPMQGVFNGDEGAVCLPIAHGVNGIFLKIRLNNQAIINVAFDNCLIYQKMTTGEQLVLLVADYLVT